MDNLSSTKKIYYDIVDKISYLGDSIYYSDDIFISQVDNIPCKLYNSFWHDSVVDITLDFDIIFTSLNILEVDYDSTNKEMAEILDPEN